MSKYTYRNIDYDNINKGIYLSSLVISFIIIFFLKDSQICSFCNKSHNNEVKDLYHIVTLIFAGYPLLVFFVINLLFRKFLWKYAGIPNLNGKYKGYLKSSFDNFQSEYEFELFIEQDFQNIDITMKMISNSSKSYNISAYLEKKNNEIFLIYNYQNEPLSKQSPTLTEHKGTAILRFDSSIESFRGNYYTDKRPIDEKEAKCNFGEIYGEKIY